MLTIGVDSTAGKQREVNMFVLIVTGLGGNLLSSSAALAKRGRDDHIFVYCAGSRGRKLPVASRPKCFFPGHNPTRTAERTR